MCFTSSQEFDRSTAMRKNDLYSLSSLWTFMGGTTPSHTYLVQNLLRKYSILRWKSGLVRIRQIVMPYRACTAYSWPSAAMMSHIIASLALHFVQHSQTVMHAASCIMSLTLFTQPDDRSLQCSGMAWAALMFCKGSSWVICWCNQTAQSTQSHCKTLLNPEACTPLSPQGLIVCTCIIWRAANAETADLNFWSIDQQPYLKLRSESPYAHKVNCTYLLPGPVDEQGWLGIKRAY